MYGNHFSELEVALIEGDLTKASRVLVDLDERKERMNRIEQHRLRQLETAYLGIVNVLHNPGVIH
ncbi:MAG: hypothetical protein AAF556_12505 [Pseudomonadota bacterium]